ASKHWHRSETMRRANRDISQHSKKWRYSITSSASESRLSDILMPSGDENLKLKRPPYRGATHKKLGDKGKMAVLAFSQARLRCDGPCQSRSRATWRTPRSTSA